MTPDPVAVRDTPTVVVARTVREGQERAYERWRARIAAAAEQAPGFVALESPLPTPDQPDERVVVYRFATAAQLQAWLDSDARRAALDRGRGIFDGEPREQVLALPPVTDPVTAVASFDVRPDDEARFRDAFADLLVAMRAFPGLLRCELLEPVDGVQRETVVLFAFATREDLDRWMKSPTRAEALARLDPMIEGDRTLNVVGGFAGWFPDTGSMPVRRWKQALVVLAALFPTALALGRLRQAVLPDLPLIPATLVGNAAGVAILTWILMPWLTRLLDGWLRR